jgi:glycosyltransferase involved in cell wall biosynthesis
VIIKNTLDPTENPLVSIILPTFNCMNYLEVTLDSLCRQTYTNYEILVVNDGSNDHTLSFLESYNLLNLKVINVEKNLGESSAINAGFQNANGSFISIISCDDPQETSWLSEMMEFISQHPGYVFYYPDLRIIDSKGVEVDCLVLQDWSWYFQLVRMKCLPSAGTILNFKEFSRPFELRDSNVKFPSDLLMFNKLTSLGKGVRVPDVIGNWRSHESNLTKVSDQTLRAEIFVANCDTWIIENTKNYSFKSKIQAKFFVRLQAIDMLRNSSSNYKYLARVLTNPKLSYEFWIFRILLVIGFLLYKSTLKYLIIKSINVLNRLKRFLQMRVNLNHF